MQVIEGQAVRIYELADGNPPTVSDYHFKHCEIIGPAILALQQTTATTIAFSSRHASEGIAAYLWEFPKGDPPVGSIDMTHCSLEDCTFINIGLVGTPEWVAECKRVGSLPGFLTKWSEQTRIGPWKI